MKIVKLSGKEVKQMAEQIIAESNKTNGKIINKPTNQKKIVEESRITGQPTRKPGRTIRLTESEMIEFLDKVASKIENSRRRRNIK